MPIYTIRSKRYLTDDQADEFFKNRIIVEEKMDGTYRMYRLKNFLLHFEDLLERTESKYLAN
ncbi:MAG: hypothetical protein N3C61_00035 [Candidatus Micrarchaeota archaeon]|nr:hypothetical protein [Candidatus Micrarchaeota archaeon]